MPYSQKGLNNAQYLKNFRELCRAEKNMSKQWAISQGMNNIFFSSHSFPMWFILKSEYEKKLFFTVHFCWYIQCSNHWQMKERKNKTKINFQSVCLYSFWNSSFFLCFLPFLILPSAVHWWKYRSKKKCVEKESECMQIVEWSESVNEKLKHEWTNFLNQRFPVCYALSGINKKERI